MSFFSIEDFIVSGEKALEAGNDYAALSVALMLPSMCSRLAYADNPDYHKADKSPKDKKCYIDWCNEIFSVMDFLIMFLVRNMLRFCISCVAILCMLAVPIYMRMEKDYICLLVTLVQIPIL